MREKMGDEKLVSKYVRRYAAFLGAVIIIFAGVLFFTGNTVYAADGTAVNVERGRVRISEPYFNTSTGIHLRWNKIEGADGYEVYRYDPAMKRWRMLDECVETTYADKGLRPATGYRYKIRAYVTLDEEVYYSRFSAVLKTATVPVDVSEAVYYEKCMLKYAGHGAYNLVSSDEPYMYIRGYKLRVKKPEAATGYVVYYQDIRSLDDMNVARAKRLMYSAKSELSLKRSARKGYTRVFWVSTYYKYAGKLYVSRSKVPVTGIGDISIFMNSHGGIVRSEERDYDAVDGQISMVRQYSARGKLKSYQKYVYGKNGFLRCIRTYNRAGKLIKTERWK